MLCAESMPTAVWYCDWMLSSYLIRYSGFEPRARSGHIILYQVRIQEDFSQRKGWNSSWPLWYIQSSTGLCRILWAHTTSLSLRWLEAHALKYSCLYVWSDKYLWKSLGSAGSQTFYELSKVNVKWLSIIPSWQVLYLNRLRTAVLISYGSALVFPLSLAEKFDYGQSGFGSDTDRFIIIPNLIYYSVFLLKALESLELY